MKTCIYNNHHTHCSKVSLMSNNTQTVATTVSQVNVQFQSIPMQDMPSFAGKVTMPGVGPQTAKKLLQCCIKNPCALLGQYMVHLRSPVVAAAVCCVLSLHVHAHFASISCAFVLQVLDCDKAQMNAWLCGVARVRSQEATVIIAALDEKCVKILAV